MASANNKALSPSGKSEGQIVATVEIGRFLKALHADGRHEVLHPQHLIRKFLVDDCTLPSIPSAIIAASHPQIPRR